VPYSTQFFAGEGGSGLAVLYTVPDQYVAVLRDLEALNLGGATDSLDLITEIPGPLAVTWGRLNNVPSGEAAQWSGRLVMNPGDQLQAYSGTHDWAILASGYLLSAP